MKKRAYIFFPLVIILIIFFSGDLEAQSEMSAKILKPDIGSKPLEVMTYNIYIGADVDPIIEAPSEEAFVVAVGNAVIEVLDTNFPERAQAIAKEIGNHKPHLIGLQEVSVVAAYTSSGPILEMSYLEILLDALEDRNLHYVPVAWVENINVVDIPFFITSPGPYFGVQGLAYLTDYDVILARDDVEVSNPANGNYSSSIYMTIGGVQIQPILRGYAAVTATVGRKSYRFVNTHLEPADDDVQMEQAVELVGYLNLPDFQELPIVLVGDLNTEAPTGLTYQYLINQGFVDTWTVNRVHSNPNGYTSGQDAGLMNEESQLDERIDLIMVRNDVYYHPWQDVGPVVAFVVGDEQNDRTPSGLWPSDHAGVTARLRLPIE